MQQEFFSGTASKNNNKTLTITKANRKPLSKNQQAFNKLTEKIERLHKEIEKKQLLFDEALQVYAAKVHPMRLQMAAHKRQMLDTLWDIYCGKKLPKTDQKDLKAVLQALLQEVMAATDGKPEDKLKKIFKELEGESFDAVAKREEALMKAEMQEMFDGMDIDIDVSNWNMDDNSTMAEKMAEVQQQIREKQEKEANQRQDQKKKKRKNPKQLEKEKQQQQVDELKQKNISTIYKQLAKLFHPDLEQDAFRKAEKEILMQELTSAYEAKNLHTLLTLELKWIHRENDHLETLTEEKLAVYLQILREQAQELDREKNQMFQQPRYMVLYGQFGVPVMMQPLATLQNAAKNLEADISFIKKDLDNFASIYGIRYVKAMLKEWKQARRHQSDEDDYLDIIFG